MAGGSSWAREHCGPQEPLEHQMQDAQGHSTASKVLGTDSVRGGS